MRYLIVLLLAGCASVTDVASYGDAYIVGAGDPGGGVSQTTLQVMAAEEANKFCARQGKKMQVKNSTVSGNRWVGTDASLVFTCVAQ